MSRGWIFLRSSEQSYPINRTGAQAATSGAGLAGVLYDRLADHQNCCIAVGIFENEVDISFDSI